MAAACARKIFAEILVMAAMKLFVGVTNNDWFRFLAEKTKKRTNFWRPRSRNEFKALASRALFLFKLHSPRDFMPGGGVCLRHTFFFSRRRRHTRLQGDWSSDVCSSD